MALAHALRDLPGVRAKADIGMVGDGGALDDSGQVRLVRGGDSAVVFGLRTEGVTNLRR
jgi:hypothetical protein